ncbi:MAG TPA: CPBP family intramembrane glutamic endopeptidase [Ktedonobacteraceae bacterium]
MLVLKGRFDVLHSAIPFFVGVPLLTCLTIPLTIGVNQLRPIKTYCSRRQLWWQTIILLLIVLFVTYRSMVFYFPNAMHIPGLYPLARWTIYFLGSAQIPPGHLLSAPKPPEQLIAIPALFVLLPLSLLCLLGARERELGLGYGHHAWRVAGLWSAIPLLGLIAVTMIGTVASLLMFVQHVGQAILQSGFFEEFLFRGALMTRLRYLLHSDWSIVLSSLLFALFSVGVRTNQFGSDWVVGVAAAMVTQATLSLGMATIFLRTRNLLAASIFHTLYELFIDFT